MEAPAPQPKPVALDDRASTILKLIVEMSNAKEHDFKYEGWVTYGDIIGKVDFPLICSQLEVIITSLVTAEKVVTDTEFNRRRTGARMTHRRVKPAP